MGVGCSDLVLTPLDLHFCLITVGVGWHGGGPTGNAKFSKFSPLLPQAAAPRQQALASLCAVCLKWNWLSATLAKGCSERRGGRYRRRNAISRLLGPLPRTVLVKFFGCHFSMKAGICNKLDQVKFFIKHITYVPVLVFIINAGELYQSKMISPPNNVF